MNMWSAAKSSLTPVGITSTIEQFPEKELEFLHIKAVTFFW
jgi:hypothetical protein